MLFLQNTQKSYFYELLKIQKYNVCLYEKSYIIVFLNNIILLILPKKNLYGNYIFNTKFFIIYYNFIINN